jgi:DNA-binding NtrC family response regulator
MGRAIAPEDDPWRVLLVDDCADDAELAELALVDGGLAVRCRRVDSAGTLADALHSFAPQVVVCDLNLAGFCGERALEMVRAHDPGLPFVILTGAVPASAPLPPADGLLLKDAMDELPGLLHGLLARRH